MKSLRHYNIKSIISVGFLILCIFTFGIFTGFKYAEPTQTEEYAMVSVREVGYAFVISTTIGENPSTIENLKYPPNFNKGFAFENYGLVLKKLHDLNSLGFSLISTNQISSNEREMSFIFKRKIN